MNNIERVAFRNALKKSQNLVAKGRTHLPRDSRMKRCEFNLRAIEVVLIALCIGTICEIVYCVNIIGVDWVAKMFGFK